MRFGGSGRDGEKRSRYSRGFGRFGAWSEFATRPSTPGRHRRENRHPFGIAWRQRHSSGGRQAATKLNVYKINIGAALINGFVAGLAEGAELPPDHEPKHQRILRHVVAKLRDIARSRISLFGASGHGKKLLANWTLRKQILRKEFNAKAMISVAGTLVADVIIRPMRDWPGKSQNAIVDRIEILPGGAVANTGMALARLGVPVSACAAVGEDNIGKVVKDSVSRWAARDAVTVIPSCRTTASVVGVSADGDRCFLSAAGACEEFSLTLEQVESEIASGSRALHIGYAMILPMLDGEPLKKVMQPCGPTRCADFT